MAQDIEARIEALEAKVQELSDQEAIRTLRSRYHECINEGKYADIPVLFSEEGELDFGYLGKAKGRTELVTFFTQGVSRVLSFVKQFIHNHTIQLSGDRGEGFSYLEAKPIYNGVAFLVAARYDAISKLGGVDLSGFSARAAVKVF